MMYLPPPLRKWAALSLISLSGAAMAQSITLTAVPLDRHGYNISCFGHKDGTIDLTVTGGTSPYAIKWSNGSYDEDVQDLPAGFYAVSVTDAMGEEARVEITLTEPAELLPYIVPYEYPNGYNVSSYNSYNGTLDLVPVGGATPYTYLWADGPTTEDRSLLGSDNYSVTVTDANGCSFKSEQVYLRAPERTDWTMSGNAGTNPATQFLGTSDNKDVVLKTNGMERFRLLSSGDIKLFGGATGTGPLYRDGDGVMKMGGFEDLPVYPCAPDLRGHPYWKSTGNTFPTLCPGVAPPVLGTRNAFALSIITNDIQRALVSPSGNIGMGDGITATNMAGLLTLRTGWNDWLTFKNEPDPNNPGDAAWSWHFHNTGSKDRLMLNNQNADGTPGPANITFWNNGKVSIGSVSTPGDYGLYVEQGIMTKRLRVAVPGSSEWSDHVFKPGYRLLPLPEVAEYIGRNGHLPGVPSAACMVEDGLDVAKTDAMLMEKVEELTLHAIDLNNRLERAEQIIRELIQHLSQTKE